MQQGHLPDEFCWEPWNLHSWLQSYYYRCGVPVPPALPDHLLPWGLSSCLLLQPASMWALTTHKYQYLNLHKGDMVIRPVKSRCMDPALLYFNVVIKQRFYAFLLWIFSLQLFDLVYREETLLNVIKSVTRNGRSIVLTAVLALILVYLFSIVGYIFFKDDFILAVDRIPNKTLGTTLPAWSKHQLVLLDPDN